LLLNVSFKAYNEAAILEDQQEHEKSLQKLCERWMADEPKSVDSLLTWTTRAEYRSEFKAVAFFGLLILFPADHFSLTVLRLHWI